MASPVAPGGPPPPPHRARSVSTIAPREASSAVSEPAPDSDAAPTVVRSEPPPRSALRSDQLGDARDGSLASAPPAITARAVSSPPPREPKSAPADAVRPAANATAPVVAAATRWLREIGSEASARASDAIEFLDVHDGWVPSRFRGRVRGSALVASGLVVLLLGVGGVVALVKSQHSVAARPAETKAPLVRSALASKPALIPLPAPRTLAPAPAQVAVAAPAAQNLESGSSDEGTLLLDSATALARESRDAEAVMLIERALLRKAELRSDPRVHDVLLRTAHSDDKASAAATFALLENAMAERGAELIYEISLTRVGKESSRRRAQSWLKGKQFAKNAALPLFIAVKLREAKSCEDKHALLPLAKGGGKQTLEYLRELQAHTTCAPDDLVNCYPCMRDDSRLSDAISAIERGSSS